MGVALGINEAAAGKRVTRAIGKLRTLFARRGVAVPVVVIAGLLSANAAQAAPAGLALLLLAANCRRQGAAISGSTLALMKTTLKLMTWTKIKIGIIAGASALLAASTTILAVEKMEDAKTVAEIPKQHRLLRIGRGEYRGSQDFRSPAAEPLPRSKSDAGQRGSVTATTPGLRILQAYCVRFGFMAWSATEIR